MRRLLTLVVVAIVASSCAQTVNVDQEKAALMTADAEWSKVAKDIDKFVAYFTPDATMSMAGMPPAFSRAMALDRRSAVSSEP